MSLVRSYNPIWFFVDLDGNALDDSYYFFVCENQFPYLPTDVYHDPQGLIPWNNPIQYNANGTLPEDIYWDENEVYRLEVRRGNTQQDQLIYEVNNYVPSSSSNSPQSSDIVNTDNQISNPNFALVNFENSVTLTLAGTYEIAPNWFLTLTGSGSTTLQQEAVSGLASTEAMNNAPYVLSFVNSGWTSAILYQRFNKVSDIWFNTAINARITGLSNSIGALPISINYVPSGGAAPPSPIASGNMTIGDYANISGGVIFTPPLNPDSGNSAHVDIQIVLPPVGSFKITNVQLISGDNSILSDNPDDVPFIQETIERQVDKLSHFYDQQLKYKQIPSYLVGWDFPINPSQLGSTQAATAIGANKSKYVWDQTIIFQSADSGVGVTRGAGGAFVMTAAATTQMAVIQYLTADQARKILNSPICCNISGKTSVVNGVVGTISLWYTTDVALPIVSSGTNNSLVATLNANGKPATFNGNWTEMPRKLGQNAQFTLMPNATANFNDYPFSGWNLDGSAAANTATYFAIVVGFASVTSTNTISLNSISLQAGDIPTHPAPQTQDEVLRQCEFYYEQSILPATVSFQGCRYSEMDLCQITGAGSAVSRLFFRDFELVFKTAKRTQPTLKFHAPDGTPDVLQMGIRFGNAYPVASGSNPINENISNWDVKQLSTSNVVYTPNNASSIISLNTQQEAAQGELLYHYSADARLGIV